MTLPTVPVPVWQQLAIVIVFAFLLAGLGWVLVRLFTQAVADVNAHYARLIKDINHQWQSYFDVRAETSSLVDHQMLARMDEVVLALRELASSLDSTRRLDLLAPPRSRAARKEH